MTEPTTDAGEQNAGTVGAARILVNFFEAHNVGHVIEALHYCLGHHRANPDMRLSVLLNALAPTELASRARVASWLAELRSDHPDLQ